MKLYSYAVVIIQSLTEELPLIITCMCCLSAVIILCMVICLLSSVVKLHLIGTNVEVSPNALHHPLQCYNVHHCSYQLNQL